MLANLYLFIFAWIVNIEKQHIDNFLIYGGFTHVQCLYIYKLTYSAKKWQYFIPFKSVFNRKDTDK